MKQKIIGTYYMGSECVQLVLREGDGGEFFTTPELGSVPRIKVGADYRHWNEVVTVLLHEAMEFQLYRHNCRFNPDADISKDHSSYLFVCNHPQFSDCCAKVAEFVTEALPDLAKAWKKWKK